jgi:hypothetical protein
MGSAPLRDNRHPYNNMKSRNFYFKGKTKTFKECYDQYSQKEPNSAIDPDILTILDNLETNLNCQGICRMTIFWLFRPITEGQPKDTCLIALKKTYDSTFGVVGWGITVSSTLLFTLLLCSCGLYRVKRYKLEAQEDPFSALPN